MKPDYSTINMKELKKLPIYRKPPTYEISKHLGDGCAGDAPGYPSYFLQSVYTQYGNNPPKGPNYVILDNEGNHRRIPDLWDTDKRDAFLRKLWIPLPEDNERVQQWIMRTYAHMKHCYVDPDIPNVHSHERMIIWPVPKYVLPLRPKQSIVEHGLKYDMDAETYRKVLSGYRAQVKALYQKAWSVVKDRNNYMALQAIRKFYPDHQLPQPISWMEKKQSPFQADWWERYDHQPSPDECPGFHNNTHVHSMHAYGNCRMCGLEDPIRELELSQIRNADRDNKRRPLFASK